jgi:anti-sigma factor RsiW
MICRELIHIIDDYLDGALTPDVVQELERHLQECAPCLAYIATYRTTRRIGAAAARVAMPEEMRARLRRFLADNLGGA